jgi:hypothetical protein
MASMFENLKLEETESDGEDLIAALHQVPPSRTAEKPANLTYELVEDEHGDTNTERILEALSFFQDLHRIEDFVCSVWRDYREGKSALATAALITNAALKLVKNMEISLDEKLGITHDRSHHDLLGLVLLGHLPKGFALFSEPELKKLVFRPQPDKDAISKTFSLDTFRIIALMMFEFQKNYATSQAWKSYDAPSISQTLPDIDVEGDRPHEAVHMSPDWVEDEKIIHKLFSANLTIKHLLSELRSFQQLQGWEEREARASCHPLPFGTLQVVSRSTRYDTDTIHHPHKALQCAGSAHP